VKALCRKTLADRPWPGSVGSRTVTGRLEILQSVSLHLCQFTGSLELSARPPMSLRSALRLFRLVQDNSTGGGGDTVHASKPGSYTEARVIHRSQGQAPKPVQAPKGGQAQGFRESRGCPDSATPECRPGTEGSSTGGNARRRNSV
jgi:hypothetical protein